MVDTASTLVHTHIESRQLVRERSPEVVNTDESTWIEASDNCWGVRLLDLQPYTQGMISMSKDPKVAANAVSYHGDDGTSFIGEDPKADGRFEVNISFPVDPILAPGVLFVPMEMEQKWALFYHDETLIIVRSWLREVVATAETVQKDGRVFIQSVSGGVSDFDCPEFVKAVVRFLLITHAIGEGHPAPLPTAFESDPQKAGSWAFSMYGNRAHVGSFDLDADHVSDTPLRTMSLHHIAAARGDCDAMSYHIGNGIPIDILGSDGCRPLHWTIFNEDVNSLIHMISLGADPDVRTEGDVTSMMSAAEKNRIGHLAELISSGADVNACDPRGYTSLHRAAGLGHIELADLLLSNGADPGVEACGDTALSLAKSRDDKEMIDILNKRT